MKRARFFLWLTAGPLAVLLAMVAVAHPYLAITERSGGDVLAVEGWMEDLQLDSAARIALGSGYQRVYTTGSVRPFAYYLKPDEAIEVVLKEPEIGTIIVHVAGQPNARFMLVADEDTLLRGSVDGQGDRYRVDPTRSISRLRITSANTGVAPSDVDNIFIKYMLFSGENIHQRQQSTRFVRRDGLVEEAWPTYAHSARAHLLAQGLPQERVIAVPSWGEPDSRSWANANYLAVRLKTDGIKALDVATLGVHARRSRALVATACGEGIKVGVISIPDPLCAPDDWWKHETGWFRLLKEIAGSPEAHAAALTR